MGTVTASLERCLQNCSLNQREKRSDLSPSLGFSNTTPSSSSSSSSSSAAADDNSDSNSTSRLIQLNSDLPLPYHWEQCLDLKTGELYYINWRTGMKAKEDPRTISTGYNGDYDSDEDSSPYDSEESSTESSSCTNSRSVKNGRHRQVTRQEAALVAAGCKSCLMYHMVPKQVNECPKCSGQLLHFPAHNYSSSSSSP